MDSLWSSTSAAGNSNFPFHQAQTNPMDCQPEPFLQIGYMKFPLTFAYVYYTLKLISRI